MLKGIDRILNIYNKEGVKYPEGNILYKEYIKALQVLIKITKDFAKFPTVIEWDKYAKEQNLMSSESIKYITGINWHDIRDRVR